MVEQSMKRRSERWAVGGRGPARMEWKTFLTWEGPGRTVSIVDCWERGVRMEVGKVIVCMDWRNMLKIQRIGFDVEIAKIMRKSRF